MSFSKAAIVFLLTIVHLHGCSSRTQVLWAATQIGVRWLSKPLFLLETSHIVKPTRLGVLCGMKALCHAFCPNHNGSSFLLSLLSVPGNVDPQGPTWMRCFTDRPRTNILTAQSGVTVYSSTPLFAGTPQRLVSNLLDGVAGTMEDCYASTDEEENSHPHVVFDLGSVKSVSNASIFSQPNVYGYMYFYDMEVQVGMSPAAANFSSHGYQTLGFYKGPVGTNMYEFRTESAKPIVGQYVAVLSLASHKLQIYHVEIHE